jgi:hypothetical protein
VDGFDVVTTGGFDDLADVQVVADVGGFVGLADVQGSAVDVGVNGDGAYVHLTQSADYAQSDLAAIGDQDFSKHRVRL